jgi:hypothetical protein
VFVKTPTGAVVPVAIDPLALAEQAEREIRLPEPPIELSPPVSPGHWQYVHVPTWAWLGQGGWASPSASAAAGGVAVTATATPVSLELRYMDGATTHTVVCSGPGTPYSPTLASAEDPAAPIRAASPSCGWTYQNSSASAPGEQEPVRATLTYRVTWTATGAAGGGNLGVLVSPATALGVRVAEVQAVVSSS